MIRTGPSVAELRELLQAADAPAGPERVAGCVDDVDLPWAVVVSDVSDHPEPKFSVTVIVYV